MVLTLEPGGTELSLAIRELLLKRSNKGYCKEAELYLFLASRAQLVREVIKPALERGQGVVCDRFSDSTIAYQGFGRGMDLETILMLNGLATNGLKPDMTLLLDIEVEEGLKREGDKKTPFGSEGVAFHERVREGYLFIARQEPERAKLIPVRSTVEETQELLRREVDALCKRRLESP